MIRFLVALDQTSDITFNGSPYANLEATVTAAAGAIASDVLPSGVTVRAQASNQYGWILTRGVGPVRIGTNVTCGGSLVIGATSGVATAADWGNLTMTATQVMPHAIGRALDTVAIARSIAPAQVWFE
jgi:hypothetical protein